LSLGDYQHLILSIKNEMDNYDNIMINFVRLSNINVFSFIQNFLNTENLIIFQLNNALR